MNRFLTLLIVFTAALTVNAQRYVVDVLFGDSIQAYTIAAAKDGSEVEGSPAFSIANGEELSLTRTLKGNSGLGAITHNGKEYCVSGGQLVMSEDNPEDAVDLFPELRKEGKFTAIDRFFTTLTPYLIIALLFIAAIALLFLGRIETLRKVALLGVPACILAASLLEIWALITLGEDVFWWCSYDRYGFWGSALRAIPFVVFVAAQVFSIKLYEDLLFGKDSDKKISIKPMAISMGACIPLTIIAIIAGAFWWKSANEYAALAVFLVSLGIGTYISWRRNVKTVGQSSGTLLTLFTAVYIIGVIIAGVGLLMLLFRLLLQILIILVGTGALIFVFGSAAGSSDSGGGGGSSYSTVWRDADGYTHTNETDARLANDRIAKRKAGL